METKQAFQIIAQACASVQADLPTHQQIQAALAKIQELVDPKSVPSLGDIKMPDMPKKEEKSKGKKKK